jgi:outer membrane scaffolding protein for murein synthesis (MipA/OmpV family)
MISTQPTNAEDRFPSLRSDSFEWGLGLGILNEDEGYTGMGSETNAQPVIYINSERFRFFANQADFQVIKSDTFLLGIKAEGRFDGFEAADSPYLAGMEEREGGWYGGLRAELKTDFANIVGEWVTELSGDSDGSYGSVGAYWTIDTEFGQWVPKVAVEFYDEDYTTYYYGVRTAEATLDRPAYIADSTVNLDVGVDWIYELANHHQLISSLKYRSYGSEVKDSPLIENSGSPRLILGYLYTF